MNMTRLEATEKALEAAKEHIETVNAGDCTMSAVLESVTTLEEALEALDAVKEEPKCAQCRLLHPIANGPLCGICLKEAGYTDEQIREFEKEKPDTVTLPRGTIERLIQLIVAVHTDEYGTYTDDVNGVNWHDEARELTSALQQPTKG